MVHHHTVESCDGASDIRSCARRDGRVGESDKRASRVLPDVCWDTKREDRAGWEIEDV